MASDSFRLAKIGFQLPANRSFPWIFRSLCVKLLHEIHPNKNRPILADIFFLADTFTYEDPGLSPKTGKKSELHPYEQPSTFNVQVNDIVTMKS